MITIALETPESWDGPAELTIRRYPFVVGRAADCDCPLPWTFISRRHCQFLLQDGRLVVQDLESCNGTFVNGRRIAGPTPLRDGDEVNFGPVTLRLAITSPRRTISETSLSFALESTNETPSLAGS